MWKDVCSLGKHVVPKADRYVVSLSEIGRGFGCKSVSSSSQAR